ncbi:MAG: hypothetical protein KBD66_04270, partial [Candidatus Doudnabacteria bacterium]|nr:hypothetical protein [Candidatus Doudnabacteria bacterium]
SQINNLSKREILESLLSRQQQDVSTLNRLVVSVAMAAGLDPEVIAEKFADPNLTTDFANTFNKALDAAFQKRNASTQGESSAVSTEASTAE